MIGRILGLAILIAAVGFFQGCEEKQMDANSNAQTQAKKDWGTLKGEGGCHCGNIRYRVNGPVINQSYCGCKACQKATGAIKAPFITVNPKSVELVHGKPAEFKSDSGWKCDCHGRWQYCPKCGTRVFWVSDKDDIIDILAGTLDDPSVFTVQESAAE